MTKASDNAFPSVLITEGTEPSAPAAGKQRLYIDSTSHHLMRTNSSGTETDIEAAAGGMAADALWDAAGDLAVGTGANTAAKLSIGAAGTVLGSNGTTASWGAAWANWTPALTATTTNPTMGTGSTVAGRYAQIGKTVIGWGRVTFGTSAAAGSGQYLLSVPVTAANANQLAFGTCVMLDNSAGLFNFGVVYTNADTTHFRIAVASTALVAANNAPWTWADSDAIYFEFQYEAA